MAKESKGNLAISSWAQIYSIAISTLTKRENLKSVFSYDYDIEGFNEKLVLTTSDCPIPLQIERIPIPPGQQDTHSNFLGLKYRISVSQEATDNMKVCYAVFIKVEADNDIMQEFQIPMVAAEKPIIISMQLKLKKSEPFYLSFGCSLNNANGSTFNCDVIKEDIVSFRDILLPLPLDEPIEDYWKNLTAGDSSLESVISLKNLTDANAFKEAFPWTKDYFLTSDILGFKVLPAASLVAYLDNVNGFVSLHLAASDYEFLDLFFNEFN